MSSHTAGPSFQPMKPKQRNWPPRLYLAVDCGGTKAAAAICDEFGQVIGKGRGGPSNYTDEGLQSFLSNVEDSITDALEHVKRHFARAYRGGSGIEWHSSEQHGEDESAAAPAHDSKQSNTSLDDEDKSRLKIITALNAIKPGHINASHAEHARFRAAWFGIAGVDSPADVTTLSPHIAKMLDLPYPSTRLIVANDTSLLASPITDVSRPDIQSGVVAISGTGSIVMSFKRSRSGMLKVLGRVGGFGWVLGDEGSGYSVGRDAVRKVLDLADSDRLAREKDDDSDSDSEESEDGGDPTQGDSFCNGVDRDMDLSTSNFTDESTASEITQRSSSPTTEVSEDRDSAAQRLDKEPTYGQMLRDRILQDWNLTSTDELLRAVYMDHAPPSSTTTANFSKDFPGVPTIIRSSSLSVPAFDASGVSSATAESTNLLPPHGTKFDEDARRFSPISSLSSSPSDSSSTALRPKINSNRSDSALDTANSSVASSLNLQQSTSGTSERKHRLAALAPLVFHLAFTHADRLCLEILRSQAHLIALQIRDILRPPVKAKAHLSSQKSVLCLGGGLVGQHRYRALLLEELGKLNISFAAVEYVADPATRGAIALSRVLEQRDHPAI